MLFGFSLRSNHSMLEDMVDTQLVCIFQSYWIGYSFSTQQSEHVFWIMTLCVLNLLAVICAGLFSFGHFSNT